MTTRSLGEEGFRWFIGVVESREDPLMLGRVRVRIVNVHSEKKSKVGTDELPWATILNVPTSASYNKIGVSPTGILVGSTVVGFFMDGNDGNNPVILGTMAGIPGFNAANHDVSPEAREINSVVKEPVGPEPGSAYASKYPYNKTIRTEKGHVIELDDTPGHERLHVYHKSGTYVEINQDGRMVTKVVDKDYQVVVSDREVYIGGNLNVQINGNATVNIDGNYDVKVGGNATLKVGGTYNVETGGDTTVKAPNIHLN